MDANICAELERKKRIYQYRHNRHAEYSSSNDRYDWNSNLDERWKNQYLYYWVWDSPPSSRPRTKICIFLYQFKMEQRHREAMRNLAKAREEAKEFGESRQLGIKKAPERVKKGE